MLKHYIEELFEPTLLYGLSLSLLGVSAAVYYGHFSAFLAVLAVAGAVLAQMSVNVISDYFDYSSGLDRELSRSKADQLSGGSSLIASGKIRAGYTLLLGVFVFAIDAVIGAYVVLFYRPELLPVLAVAALSILLYSRYVKRVPYLSELLCSFNYILIAVGSFIVVAGLSAFSLNLLFAFVPAGIMLGGNALFVNSVPDRQIDKKYGARHSAIMLGTERNIGLYYLSLQALSFVILAVGAWIGVLPFLSVMALGFVPSTMYVFNGLYGAKVKDYGSYLSTHTLSSFILALLIAAVYVIGV